MSEHQPIVLVGASGLVGRGVMAAAVRSDAAVRLVGLVRRAVEPAPGKETELIVADPARWDEMIAALRPRALICALGTTWKKAGRDAAAFRAVDHDLVLWLAAAARKAGASNMVVVSAAGADRDSRSRYMRTKGEVEAALGAMGFGRLDILRPGLLRGARPDDWRLAERAALAAAPLTDALLMGSWRRFGSVDAGAVAGAALAMALASVPGRFTHDNDAMRRAARELLKDTG